MISSQLTKTKTHPLEDIKKFYESKLRHFDRLLEDVKNNPPKPGEVERINRKIAIFREALQKQKEKFPSESENKIKSSEIEEKKPRELPREHKHQTKTCVSSSTSQFIRKLALGIPATFATAGDASSVGLGLHEMEGEKLLGIIDTNNITTIIIPAIYLLQNLAIYGGSTIESMQETIDMFKSGKLPDDWPIITNNCKKYLVEFIAALPAINAAFSDAVSSYFYISEQNFHPVLCALLGLFTAITSLFSEGVESFKTLMNLFADKKADNSEEVKAEDPSSHLKTIIYLLGIVGGIEDALNSYVSMVSTFSPESQILKNFFLAGSIGNGFCDFVFSNKIGIEALHAFFTTLSQRLPDPSEIVAFGLALFTAGLLGHIQRAFFISMVAAPEVAFPFVIPQLLTSVLSYGVAIRGGLNNVIGIFPLYKNIIRYVFSLTDTSEPKAIELTDFVTTPSLFREEVRLYSKVEFKDDYFSEPKDEYKKNDRSLSIKNNHSTFFDKPDEDKEENWELVDDEKAPLLKSI